GRVYVTGLLLQKTLVNPPLQKTLVKPPRQGAGAGLCNWSVTTEDPGEPAPTEDPGEPAPTRRVCC
ncbi:MAG: hypothetical protein KFF72_08650, partial [Arthrospira sp. SH-MAG29]